MKQLLLNAKGCSGRGVRMRVLDPTTRAAVKAESAKDLNKDSTFAEWEAKDAVMGVVATVLEMTERAGFAKPSELRAEDVVWKKLSPDDLTDHMMEYFNAKDLDALTKSFRALHDVTAKEVEDILGEALDVTVD